MPNISLEVEESRRKQFIIGIRITDKFMIEIFETCPNKSIAKQTNESLFIRSIVQTVSLLSLILEAAEKTIKPVLIKGSCNIFNCKKFRCGSKI